MSKSILIAQVTDCHLPEDPQQEYRGINPYENLKALLKKVRAIKPDLLLASGDLSEDGSRASYQALQQLLDLPGIPVLALPGNHDDPGLLEEFFPGSPVDTVGVSEHGPWQIIRLNSCLPGKPEGRLSKTILAELESVLASDQNRLRLITVHHQPVIVGSPWIDKYCLIDPEAFLQMIYLYPGVKVVVWGHIHQAYEVQRNGTVMLGSPSSAINSLPGAQKFTPDPAGPACRWIELLTDGRFQTGVI